MGMSTRHGTYIGFPDKFHEFRFTVQNSDILYIVWCCFFKTTSDPSWSSYTVRKEKKRLYYHQCFDVRFIFILTEKKLWQYSSKFNVDIGTTLFWEGKVIKINGRYGSQKF